MDLGARGLPGGEKKVFKCSFLQSLNLPSVKNGGVVQCSGKVLRKSPTPTLDIKVDQAKMKPAVGEEEVLDPPSPAAQHAVRGVHNLAFERVQVLDETLEQGQGVKQNQHKPVCGGRTLV